jgi:hypothetical protein
LSNPAPDKKPSLALLLTGIFILALAARAVFLLYPVMDSDMAIVGLMGMHILDGELPIMFYGQDYGSAIEGYVAALMFAIFGVSRYSLNFAPTLISFIYLAGLYKSARLIMPRTGALIALALAALGPFYLTWHSVLARAINIETLAAGVWLIYLTLRITRMQAKSAGRGFWLFGFGLLSGLAFWFHGLSVYFILPCGLVLWRSDLRLVIRPVFLLVVLGFALGSGPFWIYNFTHDWGTLRYLASPRPQETFSTSIHWALTKGFGVISGAMNPGSFTWFIPVLGQAILGVSVFAVLVSGLIWLKHLWLRIVGNPKAGGGELFLLVFISVLLVYATLGGASSGSARYLLSWYAVLPVMLAQALIWLMRQGKTLNLTAWILVLGLGLYFGASDLFTSHLWLPQEREKRIKNRLDALHQAEFWQTQNIRYVYSFEYWNSPRGTFDTVERMILVAPGGGRYKPYLDGLLASDSFGFVIPNGWKESMGMTLHSLGGDFAIGPIPKSHYSAAHSIKPPKIQATLLRPQGYSGTSSLRPGDAAQAFDFNACTRFSPLAPQEPGQSFTLDLGRVIPQICQLLLYSGEHHDHANKLRLEISLDGVEWKKLMEFADLRYPWFWTGKVLAYQPHRAWQEIRFEPKSARYIRLTQTGKQPQWYWSLVEIMVGVKAADSQPEPEWDQAAGWIAKAVEPGARIWCEPGLAARLPKDMRPKRKYRVRPDWMREFVDPEWLIPSNGPQFFAVPSGRLQTTLAILKSSGWTCWTSEEHGFALIKAEPPKPSPAEAKLSKAQLKRQDQYLTVDFSGELRFSKLMLECDNMAALGRDAIMVESSVDGKTFTKLPFTTQWSRELTWTGLMPLAAKAYPITLNMAETKARYLRFSKVIPQGGNLPDKLRLSVY